MNQPMLSPPFFRFMSNQQPQVPMSQGSPVLANPMQPTAPAPALQGATGNRRMSARMPQMPNNRIPMGSEGLMRIGGAGLAANNQGALATLGAMANQYGSIQDYNRAADMEAYQQEVLRANEEEARRQLALKMQQDANKKKGVMAPPTAAYSEAALAAIQAVEDNLADETWNPFTRTTGFFGNIMQAIPGTPAHDTAASINTIEAAIGFDRLQAMRDASPTGGALGQVSEMELRQLNASLGSLRQSSSREQFADNLARVKKHYMSTVAAIKAQQYEYARMMGLELPDEGSSSGEVTFDPATGKFSDEG